MMRPIDADAVERSIWREWLCSRTIKQKELCDILEKIIVRCCEHIDASPTIDVEPVRHGHWKEKRKYEVGAAVDDDGWVDLEELCSVCGKWVKTQWRSPLYCENCGAKMDGKENNND